MSIASICIFRGVDRTFDYLIPESLQDTLTIGDHVYVPFGKQTLQGLIVAIYNHSEFKHLKAIINKSDHLPTLQPELMDWIHWFAKTYRTTLYKAYQSIIGKRTFRETDLKRNHTITPSPLQLNQEQQQAFDHVCSMNGFSKHLIHGITGSGKTEIYLRLAEAVLQQGKQVIICCPEISLTPQFREQFSERFHDHIVVIHSGLTAKQRDEGWSALYTQKANLVIGPRSAIFAPIKNLGLVIIDEEHDSSYKQDNHPRYLTHDLAEWRCKYHQCPMVLGSATPSVTTFLTYQKDSRESPASSSYTHLPKRATGSLLPSITCIDMTKTALPDQLLSHPLLTAIQQRLDNNEKVMLLLNRRGYSPYVICQACKTIHSCPHCNMSYTYHRDKTFRCHRCDISIPFTHTCSHCKKPQLAFGGMAIQKIETELQQHFSKASIIRLDKDSAKTAKQIEKQLTTFKNSGDILIGTQLIAKGHHIEDVTLVGILAIDTQLNIPDFSSPERTFQLITQVAGRAGRGKKKGHVIIQTHQPDHYAIQRASQHDFDGFIDQEAAFRSDLLYPPFCELTNIILSCPDESNLKRYARACKDIIQSCSFSDHVKILGPGPAPIEKVRHHFRWRILVKHFKSDQSDIKELLNRLPNPGKDIRVITDFSPIQLL
ncbi:primosomal protein N' [bacterium]|nr:primosomal protein N' [bacterium]